MKTLQSTCGDNTLVQTHVDCKRFLLRDAVSDGRPCHCCRRCKSATCTNYNSSHSSVEMTQRFRKWSGTNLASNHIATNREPRDRRCWQLW